MPRSAHRSITRLVFIPPAPSPHPLLPPPPDTHHQALVLAVAGGKVQWGAALLVALVHVHALLLQQLLQPLHVAGRGQREQRRLTALLVGGRRRLAALHTSLLLLALLAGLELGLSRGLGRVVTSFWWCCVRA